MKGLFSFLTVCFLWLRPEAQVSIQTIVSKQPIMAGESFQIQYAVKKPASAINFVNPSFNSFRVIRGPELFTGTEQVNGSTINISNYVFTLEALKPGRFRLPTATVWVEGKQFSGNDAFVDVISKQQASQMNEDDQQLLPGENPYKKINQNLFLKLLVDRTSCFVGEPILATFKLYSRLASKSDIVKNPGFYGFTVLDVINLTDKKSAKENVNGKWFDVHTIRQVQLYPLRAGRFTIDPMEVVNEVEFSASSVNKKTEPEIIEGVPVDDIQKENVYENTISTSPVTVSVIAYPEKEKPENFTGATGVFSINTRFEKNELAKNEEGFLELTISGKGNFTQLSAPEISWPTGFEGFAAITQDDWDKSKSPLAGSRKFRYPFVIAKPGQYVFPAVTFSFFNPATKKYETLSSTAIKLTVTNEVIKKAARPPAKNDIGNENAKASKVAFVVIFSLIAAGLAYWIFSKKKDEPVVEEKKTAFTEEEILLKARNADPEADTAFLNLLYSELRGYLEKQLKLEPGITAKEKIFNSLLQSGVQQEVVEELQQLFTICESGMFTTVSMTVDRVDLLDKAGRVIDAVKNLTETNSGL